MSTPSIKSSPLVGRYIFETRLVIVVLPLPVWPTKATVVPGSATKLILLNTGLSVSYSNPSPLNSTRAPFAVDPVSVTGAESSTQSGASCQAGGVSSVRKTRSAPTIAESADA